MRRIIFGLALLALLALPASAQLMRQGAAGSVSPLYVYTGAAVGNGADLTEDLVLTYVLPAGTLANLGDRVRIYAAGNVIGSTDNKQARLKFAGVGVAVITVATASGSRWVTYTEILKNGASSQLASTQGSVFNASTNTGTGLVPSAATDTAPISITVTMQNSTNPTAASIGLSYFTVDYIRAPGS